MTRKPITTHRLQAMADAGEPIVMVTAYDYPSGILAAQAGVDIVLVGDSLAMMMLGHPTTLPATMDAMLLLTAAVTRGCQGPLVVGDLPFLSYTTSIERAVENAGRFLQEAGVGAVKLEGGRQFADTVRAIVRAGIPVMGHVGLTPQDIHVFGGFRMQGRTAEAAWQIVRDAESLQEAGAFAVVAETVPSEVAAMMAERLRIPVIGIGAGPHCDGQILVWHDLLGLSEEIRPRHAKQYANLAGTIRDALQAYAAEVREHTFPTMEHAHALKEAERVAFEALVRQAPTANRDPA